MFDEKHPLYPPYRMAKRIGIALAGGSVLCAGVAMIVLPGPALVVIPAGLGILSLEFAWARNWLHKMKSKAGSLAQGLRRGGPSPPN